MTYNEGTHAEDLTPSTLQLVPHLKTCQYSNLLTGKEVLPLMPMGTVGIWTLLNYLNPGRCLTATNETFATGKVHHTINLQPLCQERICWGDGTVTDERVKLGWGDRVSEADEGGGYRGLFHDTDPPPRRWPLIRVLPFAKGGREMTTGSWLGHGGRGRWDAPPENCSSYCFIYVSGLLSYTIIQVLQFVLRHVRTVM